MSINGVDIKGKRVVLKANIFRPEYRSMKYRVVLAYEGFGCSPDTIGRAVFVEFFDGGKARFNRSDVERVATEADIIAAQQE